MKEKFLGIPKVSISDYAYNLTANSDASNVPMEAREYTVEQLVNAAMVASANSAAIALAEQIGGTESKICRYDESTIGSMGHHRCHNCQCLWS